MDLPLVIAFLSVSQKKRSTHGHISTGKKTTTFSCLFLNGKVVLRKGQQHIWPLWLEDIVLFLLNAQPPPLWGTPAWQSVKQTPENLLKRKTNVTSECKERLFIFFYQFISGPQLCPLATWNVSYNHLSLTNTFKPLIVWMGCLHLWLISRQPSEIVSCLHIDRSWESCMRM